MKDAWFGEPVVSEFLYPFPRKAVLLTAAPQRAQPEALDVVEKRTQGPTIGRYGMVAKIAFDNLRQPSALFRDRLMHAPS